jgi:glycerophosphoryl diester phosphodiesterase
VAHPADALRRVRVRGREPIPLLEEVLEELPGTRITIELKSDAVVDPVLDVLDRTASWHRVCLGSYQDHRLARARVHGGAKVCASMGQSAAFGLRSRAWLDALPGPLSRLPAPPSPGDLAQLPRRFGALTVVDARFLQAAHRSGREVHVWVVDEPADMTALLDLGVDGLLSDRPDLLRKVLDDRGAWQRP